MNDPEAAHGPTRRKRSGAQSDYDEPLGLPDDVWPSADSPTHAGPSHAGPAPSGEHHGRAGSEGGGIEHHDMSDHNPASNGGINETPEHFFAALGAFFGGLGDWLGEFFDGLGDWLGDFFGSLGDAFDHID